MDVLLAAQTRGAMYMLEFTMLGIIFYDKSRFEGFAELILLKINAFVAFQAQRISSLHVEI